MRCEYAWRRAKLAKCRARHTRYEMASSINRQLSGPITITLPFSVHRRQGGRAFGNRELPHSSVDPVSRSSAWSMKRGQTGSSSPSSSPSSSIDARRIDPREGQTSRARWLLVSFTPPSDSAAFIHGLGRLPGTGARYFECQSRPAVRYRRLKKGCNMIEGGRTRWRKGTAREDEGTYWENGLRIEDARGEAEREGAHSHI